MRDERASLLPLRETKGHVHRWRVRGGGSWITNSEPGMLFRVCDGCSAVEQISYDEARKLGARV